MFNAFEVISSYILFFLYRDFPGCGNIVTFAQFAFIALEGFIFETNFGRKKPQIPLRLIIYVIYFAFIVYSVRLVWSKALLVIIDEWVARFISFGTSKCIFISFYLKKYSFCLLKAVKICHCYVIGKRWSLCLVIVSL